MKKIRYSCDGGAVCIGTRNARTCFTNGYGDGTFTVTVYEGGDRFDSDGWNFVGSVEGDTINIYDYDCYTNDECDNNIALTLSGRYGVYIDRGSVALEKWN